jgi:hypothetical protein
VIHWGSLSYLSEYGSKKKPISLNLNVRADRLNLTYYYMLVFIFYIILD